MVIRGKKKGEDKDRPPAASTAATEHTVSTLDMLQTSFYALYQTLFHVVLAVRWEQDHSLSESVSRDLPPRAPLRTMPPTSVLR